MKLSISSIAWPQAEEQAAAQLIRRLGVRGVEVAPTKVWPRPLEASGADVRRYRSFWESQGIRIVGMQALLFGRPDLVIFEEAVKRRETLDYLVAMADLAATLGATVLVFGSPKNRQAGPLPLREVEDIALAFFRQLGRAAADRGVIFCIEPNPVEYACDFITDARQGLEFVRRVDTPGIGLHLDTGAMTLSRDAIDDVLSEGLPWLRHFHISEPYLAQIGTGGADHRAFARALQGAGYTGWLSIEMRAQEPYTPGSVEAALRTALDAYGSGTA